jgi:polyadenylate-binding protein
LIHFVFSGFNVLTFVFLLSGQAIEALNEKEVAPGVQLYVARAQKKAEREKELRERFESINAAKQQVGVNLYVKNLSDEMTDEELCAEFSKFGGITSFKIMRDDTTGRSRGFGFVCFTSADDSTRAITEMNGRMVQNKPLYVAVAQRKDARRAQLEMMRAKAMMPAGMYPPGPMFYPPPSQGGPRAGPGGFMYPPMMPPNMRFPAGGRPFMGPAGNAPRGAPPGYMLVPAPLPNLAGGAAGAAGAAAGARQPRQPRPQQGGPAQPRQPMAAGARQGGRGQARGAVVPGGAQPLTLSSLVNASPEMQKQMIGERLYPLIAAKQPEQAGKITGMLLEMDNAELLELLDSDEARDSKIVEAMRVLQEAEGTPQ